jgi:DNA-binding PadR family transcriptional regulator
MERDGRRHFPTRRNPTEGKEPWRSRDTAEPAIVERFSEAAVLLVLCESQETLHGYRLAGLLREQGLAAGVGDLANLYRMLRHLEAQGLVASSWEQGGGPARRLYSVTPAGAEALRLWAISLHKTRVHIRQFLDRFVKLNRRPAQAPPAAVSKARGRDVSALARVPGAA